MTDQVSAPRGVTRCFSLIGGTAVWLIILLNIPLSVVGQENQLPVSSFTCQPEQPRVGEEVICDASPSYDPDGLIVRYLWDFNNDGVIDAEGVRVKHIYNQVGEQNVTLLVVDNDGVSSLASKVIAVSGEKGPRIKRLSLGIIYFMPSLAYKAAIGELQGGFLILGGYHTNIWVVAGLKIKIISIRLLNIFVGASYINYAWWNFEDNDNIQLFLAVTGLETYPLPQLAMRLGVGAGYSNQRSCHQGGCYHYSGSIVVPLWELFYYL